MSSSGKRPTGRNPITGELRDKSKHRFNKSWVQEHVNDTYVQRARAEGWRSRAAFKLLELDEKLGLIRPGMSVVDLGSAPGSWSQVVARKVGDTGKVLALDLLPMDPIRGVYFIQGDFREEEILAALTTHLGKSKVDLVLSDMAPNLSGIPVTDQARVMYLAELTLEFCGLHLRAGGDLLVKVFQGSGFDELRKSVSSSFESVGIKKPAASRDRSAETYLLARGYRG